MEIVEEIFSCQTGNIIKQNNRILLESLLHTKSQLFYRRNRILDCFQFYRVQRQFVILIEMIIFIGACMFYEIRFGMRLGIYMGSTPLGCLTHKTRKRTGHPILANF